MKRLVWIFVIVITMAKLHGQGYYEITFTGAGAAPDSILVENLTKGTSVSMQGADVLHLVLVASVLEVGRVNSKLNIYPNPMDYACHFEFMHAKRGTVDIQLYATDGRLLHSYSRELSQGKHSFMLSGVSAGAYILSIQTQSENISGRFVSTGPPKAVFSLVQTKDLPLPKTGEINTKDGFSVKKVNTKGTKAIVNMDFTLGDQLRFIGSATSFPNDTVYASPTGNQTIHFVFVGLPTITTDSITYITSTTAVGGGNVTNDGGASVTARGVCWDTTANPVATGNHTTDGTGTGAFTSSITGLSYNTTYYVRAYATNSAGTAYGNQISFTTSTSPNYPPGYVHCNPANPTAVVDVTNPATGKTWMDRNLGASQAATSSTDSNAYGDLYQWGRFADGHQCRNSATTTTLSTTNQPGHGSFILAPNSPYDWRSPQNTNLWQGVNGVNNPCPADYSLPTEAEWNAERLSWSSNNAAGAFASPLKLPLAGYRYASDGSLDDVGSFGLYWSSTVSSISSRRLYFSSNSAGMGSGYRAPGTSVRCIKDSVRTDDD